MMGRPREREVLERSVQASRTRRRRLRPHWGARHRRFPADGRTMLAAKRLPMKLLTTKGQPEQELALFVLPPAMRPRTVHWVWWVGP